MTKDEQPFDPKSYSAFKRAATMSTEAFMPMDETAPHSHVEQMRAALTEAERFMAYFASETDGHFVGDGTPASCLAQIRAALRSSSPCSGAGEAVASEPRFVNCEVCQTEGRILTSDGGPYEIDNGVCPACNGRCEVEVETEPCGHLTECPACKQLFENGGQCAAPVMRGGCPMGGDV